MTHFCIQWKRVGGELNSGEPERERERARERDTVLLQMGYRVGNKLDRWTNIYYSYRKDNPRSYHDEQKDYLQEFKWLFFSCFFI
jgi:hypothetical protein